MEKRKVAVCFSEQKHVFYGNMCSRMCFRMLALDSALLSCLRRVEDLETNTFSGFRFAILPPAGQRSQTKHVPGNTTRIYSIYCPYSPIPELNEHRQKHKTHTCF